MQWRRELARIAAVVCAVVGSMAGCGDPGCSRGPDGAPGRGDDTLLLSRDSRGVYVGTVGEPRRWFLGRQRDQWALSADERYLAVGSKVLDVETGTQYDIDLDTSKRWSSIRLCWSPTEPVLGISYKAPRYTEPPPPDPRDIGRPFMTWRPETGRLKVYENAKVDENFHWMKDGRRVLIVQGDRLGDEAYGYVYVTILDVTTGAIDRKRITNPQSPESPLALERYPVKMEDVYFDWRGSFTVLVMEYPWPGHEKYDGDLVFASSAAVNPRTGEVALTHTSFYPGGRGVYLWKPGSKSEETLITNKLKPSGFYLEHSMSAPWYPWWLKDDRHILVMPPGGTIYCVDTQTGAHRVFMRGVRRFLLLDPDVRKMLVNRVIKGGSYRDAMDYF